MAKAMKEVHTDHGYSVSEADPGFDFAPQDVHGKPLDEGTSQSV